MRKNLPIINLFLILAVVANFWLLRDDEVPPPVAKRIVEPTPIPQSVQKPPVQPKQEAPKTKIAKAPVKPSPPKPRKPKRVSAPAPKKQVAPKAPTPTAPQISLHGVVLLNGTRIAILDGAHAAGEEDRYPKRKSYKIGDPVGNYRVREIDRNSVTLADSQGKPLKIKMTKRSSSTP